MCWRGTSTPTGQTDKVPGNCLPAQFNLIYYRRVCSRRSSAPTTHGSGRRVHQQVVIVDLLFIIGRGVIIKSPKIFVCPFGFYHLGSLCIYFDKMYLMIYFF